MKSKKLPIIYFLATLLLFACKDDKDDMDNMSTTGNPVGIVENSHTSGQTVSADFRGRITNQQGSPIAGAMVSAGGSITITNAQGFYQIEDAAVDDNYALIKVEYNGMFDQFRALKPRTDKTNYADIAMIQKVVNGFFSTASGGVINIPGGPTVSFPAGELVTSGGQPYSGEVLVASTYLDPSDRALMSYMPGSLAAVDDNGEAVGMITYGMVGVELTAASNGQKLQLAGGRKATITLPLPETHASHAPESIPLWYFDEVAGIWQEEGVATRSGNSYVGQVSHFSFWNCDIPVDHVTLTGSIVLDGSAAYSDVFLRITRPDGSFAYGWLESDGTFSGIIPAFEDLTFEISFGCGDIPIYTATIGPFSEDAVLDPIDLSGISDDTDLLVEGTVIDCDGNPLPDVLVTLNDFVSGISVYTAADEDGEFSILLGCMDAGQIGLSVLDPATLTASGEDVFDYNVSDSDYLSAGDLSFCDEESLPDFITFDDGVNQITFEEIEFDFEATGCNDFYAFNEGSTVVDFIEGMDIEIVTTADSTGIVGCGTDPVEVRGYLPSGDYLVYSSGPGTNYYFDIPNIIEGDDATLYEGLVYFNSNNQSIQIYEDESMTNLVDEYFAESIFMSYQFIW